MKKLSNGCTVEEDWENGFTIFVDKVKSKFKIGVNKQFVDVADSRDCKACLIVFEKYSSWATGSALAMCNSVPRQSMLKAVGVTSPPQKQELENTFANLAQIYAVVSDIILPKAFKIGDIDMTPLDMQFMMKAVAVMCSFMRIVLYCEKKWAELLAMDQETGDEETCEEVAAWESIRESLNDLRSKLHAASIEGGRLAISIGLVTAENEQAKLARMVDSVKDVVQVSVSLFFFQFQIPIPRTLL